MKAGGSTSATGVGQAFAKGTCPICAILKDYQWTLAAGTQPSRTLQVCNFHCWSLARSRGSGLSRSTPGEAVTNLFVEMLREPVVGKVPAKDCDLCRQVLDEEAVRLRELRNNFRAQCFANG